MEINSSQNHIVLQNRDVSLIRMLAEDFRILSRDQIGELLPMGSRIMNLDRREALIKVFNKPTIDIHTPEIKHANVLRRKTLSRKPTPPPRITNSPKPGPDDDLPTDFHE